MDHIPPRDQQAGKQQSDNFGYDEQKFHNEIIQKFCVALHQQILQATGDRKGVEPVFVFDRGFARAKYVIKFLDDKGITVVMRVPHTVGVRVDGSLRKLDDLEEGGYSDILYQATEALPLNLYVVRDEAHDDPMYLISNRIKGIQIHTYYKRQGHSIVPIHFTCVNFFDRRSELCPRFFPNNVHLCKAQPISKSYN